MCAERLGKSRQVFVQGKKAKQAVRSLAISLGLRESRVGPLLFVVGDGFGIEGTDFENVERDASSISTAGPLRILNTW